MTVQELGALCRKVATDVTEMEFLEVIGDIGKANLAVQEFLLGFRDPARGSLGDEDWGDVTLGLHEVESAVLSCERSLAAGEAPRNAPREFNPAWIPLILEGVKMLAALIKQLRDNRVNPVVP